MEKRKKEKAIEQRIKKKYEEIDNLIIELAELIDLKVKDKKTKPKGL